MLPFVDLSVNIFLFTQSRLQIVYFVFSDPADSFLSIFLTAPSPLQKNNAPSLRVSYKYLNCGLINEDKSDHCTVVTTTLAKKKKKKFESRKKFRLVRQLTHDL